MHRIRPFLAWAAALAVTSGIALLPVLTSATPASATSTCAGTSLVNGGNGETIRVPTVGNATPAKWGCILGSGDSSTAVSRLQIDLNDCYRDDLTVDGIYGPDTEAAVKQVQAELHVTQDGIYGPQTIEAGFVYQIQGEPVGLPTSCTNIAAAG
jgi:peptidoglycan hydrolase-like protein with peptidoglycan-binding domain